MGKSVRRLLLLLLDNRIADHLGRRGDVAARQRARGRLLLCLRLRGLCLLASLARRQRGRQAGVAGCRCCTSEGQIAHECPDSGAACCCARSSGGLFVVDVHTWQWGRQAARTITGLSTTHANTHTHTVVTCANIARQQQGHQPLRCGVKLAARKTAFCSNLAHKAHQPQHQLCCFPHRASKPIPYLKRRTVHNRLHQRRRPPQRRLCCRHARRRCQFWRHDRG